MITVPDGMIAGDFSCFFINNTKADNSFWLQSGLKFFYFFFDDGLCRLLECRLLSVGNDGNIGGHHTKKYPAFFGEGIAGIYFL